MVFQHLAVGPGETVVPVFEVIVKSVGASVEETEVTAMACLPVMEDYCIVGNALGVNRCWVCVSFSLQDTLLK